MLRYLRTSFIIIVALLFATPVFSQITFSSLDLNSSDMLLYLAETKSKENITYKKLYRAKLTDNIRESAAAESKLLTCFPEKLEVFQGGKLLQIRNSDGIAEYSVADNTLKWVSGKDSVNMAAVSVSPDGNWQCRFVKKTAARADLILENMVTGKTRVLAPNTEFSYSYVPVSWSPDSERLIYEKEGELYFLETSETFSLSAMSEEFRKIGHGAISNVCWATSSLLVYINHDIVYKIATNEFYTRALYADLMGSGSVAGRLPNAFDNRNDAFWTNADASSIVLVQNNRTLWYMELEGTDFNFITTLYSYPFVSVPGTAVSFKVFWTEEAGVDIPIVWIEQLHETSYESYVYKLTINSARNSTYFTALPLPVFVTDPMLSPDGKMLCFRDKNSLHVYKLSNWQQIYVFAEEDIVSFRWIDRRQIFIGGAETIRIWEPGTQTSKVLLLSSAERFAWNAGSNDVIVSNSYGTFKYNEQQNVWDSFSAAIVRKAVTQNTYFRVFLGSSGNPDYKNAIYVRSLTGLYSTSPLYREQVEKEDLRPALALVLDALDNADGLAKVLEVLKKNELKVTFFINGEFIRRFPTAVQEIAESGHECASMFITAADLTSSTFISDESFIRRGLARNEDEFFALTGGELTLYWHAPQFKADPKVITSGKAAGYTYVESSTPLYDTTTLENAAVNGEKYYTTAEVIDNLSEYFAAGAVIPVSLGMGEGTRSDYLYNRFDVLVEAILDAGYRIVPVSEIR
ncbi:MAG: polysaccharide deacetylase family protein [Spirochaetaceae bacterium]|nr:polysaccharide deacetylase family protein [Spirochaetaceae bacterium]MBO4706307.1 polysaccharide deacetylase family protein [Spirochaetaceae bacterium]